MHSTHYVLVILFKNSHGKAGGAPRRLNTDEITCMTRRYQAGSSV